LFLLHPPSLKKVEKIGQTRFRPGASFNAIILLPVFAECALTKMWPPRKFSGDYESFGVV
jgi:hypothetical protein